MAICSSLQLYIYFQKTAYTSANSTVQKTSKNVNNHRYNIPQSWPGNTKQVYLALEKLLTPAYQCNVFSSLY